MIAHYVNRAVLVAAAGAACYALAERLGPVNAAVVWAAAAAAACGAGTALLRTSEIGRVTWRNRLAGYLIPWGWRLNRGVLWPAPVISWLVWMAVGAAVLVLRPEAEDEAPATGVRLGLFAAWVVDAAALMFLAGSIRQATPGGRVGALWKLAGAVVVVLGGSVALSLAGQHTPALVVGGGPPAVIGAGVGLFALLLVTVGRNARWN